MLEHYSKEYQLDWLEGVANEILGMYVLEQSRAVPDIYEDRDYMESQPESLQTRSPEKCFVVQIVRKQINSCTGSKET